MKCVCRTLASRDKTRKALVAAPQRARTLGRRSAVSIAGFLVACTTRILPHGSDGSVGETAPGSGGFASGTTSNASTTPGTPEDTNPGFFTCSVYEQDCPRGEKCVPTYDGSWRWNGSRCTQVAADPDGLGEQCTVQGDPMHHEDSCEVGAVCFLYDADHGECWGLCTGSAEAATCSDPETSCSMDEVGPPLCIPQCDPLAQDCLGDRVCVFVADMLQCIPQAGEGGTYGTHCASVSACDPGLQCVPAAQVPGCLANVGCCTPFCDVTSDPSSACVEAAGGQECVPVFGPGEGPSSLADIGLCRALQ